MQETICILYTAKPKQIDASDFATLDATQKSYLGFAYAYRAMFYLDLVRLYEFKENNYTEAPGVLGLGVPIVRNCRYAAACTD